MSVTVTPYFTPTSITGCQLWLDAADSSTITVSGSNVTNVADKSGNGIVLSNATGFTYPNNSFNGSYPSFLCSSGGIGQANNAARLGINSAFAQTTPFTVFFVSHQTQTSSYGYIMDSQSGSGRQYTYNNTLSTPFGSSATDITSTPSVVSMTWIAGTSVLYLNGTSNYSGSLGSFTTGGIIVGNRFSINESWPGHICELIYFSGQLGTTQRQQMEGYLAQKWGLSSILPADHPVRNAILFRSSIPAPVKVTAYSFPASTIVYTGSFIPYTVPGNCTSLTFNMWGAGGSGGNGNPGGGGAYNTGRIAVTSGETLQLIVGRGGQYGTATQWSTMTAAEGGGGGGGGLSGQGGQGGGRTAIQKLVSGSYLEVVTAGGGGSAGGNAGTYGGNAYYTGTSQSAGTTYGQGRVPTGGSATAGGLNTFVARVGFPWDGTQFTGGFASNAFNVSPVTGACGGGGGGGGYYGGGGGGRSGADTYGGGGGGSYCNVTYITNYSGSNGTSNVAVASGIAGYITGCGRGGSSGSTNNGSNGLIVITPLSPNPIAAFKTTGSATGGTITTANGYRTHSFTTVGSTNFVVTGVLKLQVLVVGGGGAGASGYESGGGGAGGAVFNSGLVISAGTYSATVGNGGAGAVILPRGGQGASGTNSSFLTLTGNGGGGGGNYGDIGEGFTTRGTGGQAANGGCGGGGGGNGDSGVAGTAGSGNQGYGGGTSTNYGGSGGGGMGSAGSNATTAAGASGGLGLTYQVGNQSYLVCGGGGGGSELGAAGGSGGSGIGGNGGVGNNTPNGTAPTNGAVNTGSGGGGSYGYTSQSHAGGNGGSGIVIIAYAYP